MKTALLSLILLLAAKSALAFSEMGANASTPCRMYADERNLEGARRETSLAVCQAAVDSLIAMGEFTAAGVKKDPSAHLNKICGPKGTTFQKNNKASNKMFLDKLRANLGQAGYVIDPNDFEAMVTSLALGQEADLFAYQNTKNISCSSLLYVVFRIEIFVRAK